MEARTPEKVGVGNVAVGTPGGAARSAVPHEKYIVTELCNVCTLAEKKAGGPIAVSALVAQTATLGETKSANSVPFFIATLFNKVVCCARAAS